MAIFYEDLLRALQASNVRYVVVGGTAVILHGVPRTTADLDVVVDLAAENRWFDSQITAAALPIRMDLTSNFHQIYFQLS